MHAEASNDRSPSLSERVARSGKQTLVVVATYNERENLPRLVETLFRVVPDADLLVVDDNSPDGTGRWCDEQASRDARLRCLHREGKLGLGTATIAGLRYAVEHGYTYVVNMDADLSHDPRFLPDLLSGMEREGSSAADVVIGSRYVPGGRIEGWPLGRRLISRAVNLYGRALLGLSTKDCSGSFRCYRVERLRELDFDAVGARGYAVFEELLWHLKRLGARFEETPITFTDRQVGTSKVNTREALAAITRITRLGVKNWLRL